MGLIVAFYLRLTDRIMSPRSGFRFVSSVFPGIPLLKQLHRRAIIYRPSPGLKIPQPFGLPCIITTAVPAVISLSSQRIISLMATAMNFAARQGNFAIEYQK